MSSKKPKTAGKTAAGPNPAKSELETATAADGFDFSSLKIDLPDLEGMLDLPDFEKLTDAGAAVRGDTITEQLKVRRFTRTHRDQAQRTTLLNLRKVKAAADALKRMPDFGEYIHAIVGQEFAGFDLLATFLELTQAPSFDRLYLTTLGFSRDNLTQLGRMCDAGTLKPEALTILCGDFFRRADRGLWDIGALLAKEKGFGFRSFRNHTKLILAELNGLFFVVESSANLRSCANIELFTICQNPALFSFHAEWIDEVFSHAAE